MNRLKVDRRTATTGGAIVLAILGLGLVVSWLLPTQWTAEEAEQAANLRQAINEVRGSIEFANRRGGMLEPEEADILIERYTLAEKLGATVSDEVLRKVHPDLVEVWPELFMSSTRMYIRAFIDLDRSSARQAGFIQDDWIRWLNLNGDSLNFPEPKPR